MKRNQLTTIVLGMCLLLGSATQSVRADNPPSRQFGMKFKGGSGSLKDPMVFTGSLKDFDQRTYKFSKRIICMQKGFQYIIKVNSYDFKPRVFLREFDDGIVARGEISSFEEKTKAGTWTVHENKLRFSPSHDEYILEISHYEDEPDAPRAFSLFVYKLPLDNPWAGEKSEFRGGK